MTRQTLKLFWGAVWRYKWLLILTEIGATIFVLSSAIISPFVVSKIIDKLTLGSQVSVQEFYPLLLVFAVLGLVNLVAGRLMMMTYIRLEPSAQRDLENLAFRKLQGHSLAFFADNFTGALVAKVNRLTNSFQRVVEITLGDFGMLLRRYIASIIVITYLSPAISMVFVIWTVIFCSSLVYLHRRKIGYSRAAASAQTEVTARLADIIGNTMVIRSFSRTKDEQLEFEKLSNERRDLRFRSYLISDYIRLYKSATFVILQFAVLYFSIRAASSGSLTVGSIVLIQFYLIQLLAQLWNFGRFMDRMEESLADAAEMTEIIMQPHEVVDPKDPEKSRISHGQIEFKKVSFKYPEQLGRANLFDKLNLQIPAGQKVGLVGPSGGGKTTFTKLLLRFMDIQDGEILIDGQNIAKLKQEDLRREISYVPQEPLLFHRSIFENISYGSPKATKEEVYRAAKYAHAEEFIKQLPKKYETIVGERGVKLSGGQRQRVAIARAMLKNSPILLLDEATSSLDSVSEKLIAGALDKLMESRTTIVVAHRLSTIRKLDRILVIKDGKIVEDGNHDTLVKKKGLYAKLWSHQSGSFIGEN